jgi:hypothetical protein
VQAQGGEHVMALTLSSCLAVVKVQTEYQTVGSGALA